MMRCLPFFLICCALAGAAPLLKTQNKAPADLTAFPGWPSEFEGRTLTALPLTGREKRFAEDFPGKIGRFTDGSREIIIRWVTRETRSLHPASDCFKGSGYKIHPLPVKIDESGVEWGSFEASRGSEMLHVTERIYSATDAKSFTDVSTWYWRAILRQTSGPWWAVTAAKREQP